MSSSIVIMTYDIYNITIFLFKSNKRNKRVKMKNKRDLNKGRKIVKKQVYYLKF